MDNFTFDAGQCGLHARFSLQVLSALDILQPPHLDFFQEMYPLLRTVDCYGGRTVRVSSSRVSNLTGRPQP